MRILLLTAYFPPDTGSAAHLFYELGRALVEQGQEVTVLTGFPTYHAQGDLTRFRRRLWLDEMLEEGMRVARVAVPHVFRNTPIGRGLWQFSCAGSFAVRGMTLPRPDIVLTYSPPLPLGLTAWALRLFKKTPFVLNVQDLFPKSAVDLGILNNNLLIRFFERLERCLYRQADHITVHSCSNREHVLSRGGETGRLTVTHNWVDVDFIRPGKRHNEFSREHGVDDKFVVSFAGVVGHSQDIDVILEAANLLKGHNEIRFLVVGDGVEKARLEQKARDLKLTNVQFLPMQPRDCYPAILQTSDVSLATLRAEVASPVVPSKILSIMSAGRPIIACMNLDGDAPQLIKEAQCGYALPAGDSQALAHTIITLYGDVEMREKLGRNGRHYAERYLSVQAGAERYLHLFASLLAE